MPENSTRRRFMTALTAGLAVVAAPRVRTAERQNARAGQSVDQQLVDDLVTANRILAQRGILDEFGHVSVRDPRHPTRYLMSRALAPELVTAGDIIALDLDSAPLEGDPRPLYGERFIHGEIYKARADVNAVVHHHAASIIPFSVTTVPLKPVTVAAGFIVEGIPVFDTRMSAGATEMLVNAPDRGRALARTLGGGPAVLIRGHGAAVVGASLPITVARSVYLELNARLQMDAMRLGADIAYLEGEEARRIAASAESTNWINSWTLWKQRARAGR
jgi:ribulose-5-phosphate 4-epimerase/fuculose-1-phosphate aldolase